LGIVIKKRGRANSLAVARTGTQFTRKNLRIQFVVSAERKHLNVLHGLDNKISCI
jgi:hypothetical protein